MDHQKIHLVWLVNDLYANNFISVYRECKNNPDFLMTVVAVPHLGRGFAHDLTSAEVHDFLLKHGVDSLDA